MLKPVRCRGRRLAWFLAAAILAGSGAMWPAGPASADTVRDTEMWVLDALNVQPAWQITQGRGVLVAVIDSGVDGNVSDLVGSVRQGPNLTGVDTPPSSPDWGVHGTWMASLIAGHGHGPGDDSGIIGIAPQSRILSIRVITDSEDPNFSRYEHESISRGQQELATAITYAVAHGAMVISMSLGYSLQSATVRQALQDAYEHDVVVVAAAGNSGEQAGVSAAGHSPYSFPADYPGVLAVGAVDQQGQPADFSSHNLSVQVAAPGFEVPAQGRDGQYWLVSGTSPACALTAGVAALIKARYPRLTDPQVFSAITTTTTPSSRPAGGYDDRVGFGEVNAAAALTAAGRLATAARPAAGLASAAHFGGGIAAVPAPPVQPRGVGILVLYCLLGACSLALVGIGVSRLFTLGESAAGPDAAMAEPGPSRPVSRIVTGPPGRHAAPRGRGDGAGEQ
jgi:type VII secretion-associated serine protease mycosin